MPAIVGVLQIVNANGIPKIQVERVSGSKELDNGWITVANNGVGGACVVDLNLIDPYKVGNNFLGA